MGEARRKKLAQAPPEASPPQLSEQVILVSVVEFARKIMEARKAGVQKQGRAVPLSLKATLDLLGQLDPDGAHGFRDPLAELFAGLRDYQSALTASQKQRDGGDRQGAVKQAAQAVLDLNKRLGFTGIDAALSDLDQDPPQEAEVQALRDFADEARRAQAAWLEDKAAGMGLALTAARNLVEELDPDGRRGLRDPKTEHHDPLTDLCDALADHAPALTEAESEWQAANYKKAAALATDAAFTLTERLGLSEVNTPLFNAVCGFEDLDNGRRVAWMEAEDKGPALQAQDRLLRALAVVTLKKLKATGLGETSAAEDVANAMIRNGYPKKRGQRLFGAATVTSWRKKALDSDLRKSLEAAGKFRNSSARLLQRLEQLVAQHSAAFVHPETD